MLPIEVFIGFQITDLMCFRQANILTSHILLEGSEVLQIPMQWSVGMKFHSGNVYMAALNYDLHKYSADLDPFT